MLLGSNRETDRPGPINIRAVLLAAGLHVGLFLFFWGMSAIILRPPDVIVPIDMTIVPPWAQQTDDPEPDPNPLPKPEPPKPKPRPPEPEPEPKKVEKVEAVEKIVEKKKPLNLREKAKLVKTPPKPPEKVDLRDRATRVEPPPMPTPRVTGKATAAEKPLSAAEIQKLLNQGYRYGSKNQLATDEAQRCVSVIAQAIRREWDKESFKWYPGLQPLQILLQLGPGGSVRGFRVLSGSGDPDVDRTARAALGRLRTISGLSATFLDQFPEIAIEMKPVSGG